MFFPFLIPATAGLLLSVRLVVVNLPQDPIDFGFKIWSKMLIGYLQLLFSYF